MERPNRLILDWIFGLAIDPDSYPRNSEDAMIEFGLSDDQRAVLLHKDPTLIRKWVEYELQYSSSYGGHMHFVCMVMHGVPPPPPPPPPP